MLVASVLASSTAIAQMRQWQDPSGQYRVEAKFVTADEKHVVLKQADGELVILQRDQLSSDDQQFLGKQVVDDQAQSFPQQSAQADNEGTEEPTAEEKATAQAKRISKWQLRDGQFVEGLLVGFGSQDLVVRRERGKVFVNDMELKMLSPAYQKILPSVASVVDAQPIQDVEELEKHIADLGGGPIKYVVQGIQLGTPLGGTVTIPIELLESQESQLVTPGFARWRAAHAEELSEADRYAVDNRERLILDSYERTREEETAAKRRALKRIELGLLSVEAGIVDIWEVTLYPNTQYGYPQFVVVPARDSQAAKFAALQKYPGWVAGAIRKLSN